MCACMQIANAPIRLNGESGHFPYQTKGVRAPIFLADI